MKADDNYELPKKYKYNLPVFFKFAPKTDVANNTTKIIDKFV